MHGMVHKNRPEESVVTAGTQKKRMNLHIHSLLDVDKIGEASRYQR
jgi:hypothetical protein